MKLRVFATLVALMVLATPASAELKIRPQLHYAPLGLARSYNVASPSPERNYLLGGMVGVTYFPLSFDGGRILLFGTTVSTALALRQNDPGLWAAGFVPVSVRVKNPDRLPPLYLSVVLARTELESATAPRGGLYNLRGYATVGVQLSLCIVHCQ